MGRRLPWQHPHIKKSIATPARPTQTQQSRTESGSSATMVRPRLISTPRKPRSRGFSSTRPAPARPTTPSGATRLDGLFSDGQWFCNCEPRLPAESFVVKKETPNKGKTFFRCRACDFFKWDDDAGRTGGVVVSTPEAPLTRGALETPSTAAATPRKSKTPKSVSSTVTLTESTQPQLPTPSTADARRISPRKQKQAKKTMCDFFPKSPRVTRTQPEEGERSGASSSDVAETPQAETSTVAQKRKRVQFEEEEDFIGDESSDEERQMTETAERSAQKLQQNSAVSTPTTATRLGQTNTVGELATPTIARTLFPGPDAKRQKISSTPGPTHAARQENNATGMQTPGITPSTNRTGKAPSPDPSKQDDGPDTEMTDEIMTILKGQPISPTAERALRDALHRHTAKARGLVKSRDFVRDVLKEKDEKISELQGRVVALEDKVKLQKQTHINVRAGMIRLFQDS